MVDSRDEAEARVLFSKWRVKVVSGQHFVGGFIVNQELEGARSLTPHQEPVPPGSLLPLRVKRHSQQWRNVLRG